MRALRRWRASQPMAKITWITAAEIEANLAATIAEANRQREKWFDTFTAC